MGGRSRPRLRNMVNVTWHSHIHVGVCPFHNFPKRVHIFGRDPSFPAKHASDISFEHIEGMIYCFFPQDNP
ncbi:unnamed protein product [Pseudo-nitzschia multistriata]|uniref:Uncharacterized protein n=1 Tax=Pseudo-nitzschia multistriata TaxID=183589 RepID=A0A448Z8Z5_9STRA|nr:unnamed protein product [Pseudo-nitzschia multistriata]